MNEDTRIFVAGVRGMVGSAVCRVLKAHHYTHVLAPTHQELDLTDQRAVRTFFADQQPEVVVVAAAKVGGIHANNSYPADFIYDNLMIEANVIQAAWEYQVGRLIFLGSSCIYPKHAEQPLCEEALLTGTLEATNEPYAIAKIAGIKLCESYNRQHATDFRSLMPCNLYGPGDNFSLHDSHVIPAMMRKFHEAKTAGDDSVELWGSGGVYREFLYVDDLAVAVLFVMETPKTRLDDVVTPMNSHLNVGPGKDLTIKALAELLRRVVGYSGVLRWNTEMPDGTPRKVMNVGKLKALGWESVTPLEQGLQATYAWYLENERELRK